MKENLEGELGREQRDRGLRLLKLICKPYQYPCDGRPPRFLAMSAKKEALSGPGWSFSQAVHRSSFLG